MIVKIDLGEDVGPLQNLKRQQDEWQGVMVLQLNIIQTMVINGELECFGLVSTKKTAPAMEKDSWMIPTDSRPGIYSSKAFLCGP